MDPEPEPTGTVVEALDAALRHVNRLNVLAAYVPTLANRTTHLTALQAGAEGLLALALAANPLDEPEEP